VTLHNKLVCHRLSDHLHYTDGPVTYVLRKDICLHSLADQNVHRLEKMFSTKYHAKATWTVRLDWSSAMGALQ